MDTKRPRERGEDVIQRMEEWNEKLKEKKELELKVWKI